MLVRNAACRSSIALVLAGSSLKPAWVGCGAGGGCSRSCRRAAITAATAKPAAMTRKNPAAAHSSPGVGGLEAEAEGRTPEASNAEPPAITSATLARPAQAPKLADLLRGAHGSVVSPSG
jgi:hypothetical protein